MRTVSAVYRDRTEASRAVDELVARGFLASDISVVMSDDTHRMGDQPHGTKAAEGAAVGAATGGVLGGIIAAAAAIGSVIIPGLGLVVAGPLLGVLTGAVAGTATGAAAGSTVPDWDDYRDDIAKGAIWVGVHAFEGQVGTAREALRAAGGERISSF